MEETKTSKIGELNFKRFKTSIHATKEVKALFKKEKISLSMLIPTAWAWYESELLEATNERGEDKIDEKFGKDFKIIYLTNEQSVKEFEISAILTARIRIKNIKLKYVALKD